MIILNYQGLILEGRILEVTCMQDFFGKSYKYCRLKSLIKIGSFVLKIMPLVKKLKRGINTKVYSFVYEIQIITVEDMMGGVKCLLSMPSSLERTGVQDQLFMETQVVSMQNLLATFKRMLREETMMLFFMLVSFELLILFLFIHVIWNSCMV